MSLSNWEKSKKVKETFFFHLTFQKLMTLILNVKL